MVAINREKGHNVYKQIGLCQTNQHKKLQMSIKNKVGRDGEHAWTCHHFWPCDQTEIHSLFSISARHPDGKKIFFFFFRIVIVNKYTCIFVYNTLLYVLVDMYRYFLYVLGEEFALAVDWD